MNKKKIIIIVFAVFLACVSILLFKDYVYDLVSKPTYIVYADKDIKAGEPIMVKDLKYKQVDIKNITDDYTTETSFQKVLLVKGKNDEKTVAETILVSLKKIKVLEKIID